MLFTAVCSELSRCSAPTPIHPISVAQIVTFGRTEQLEDSRRRLFSMSWGAWRTFQSSAAMTMASERRDLHLRHSTTGLSREIPTARPTSGTEMNKAIARLQWACMQRVKPCSFSAMNWLRLMCVLAVSACRQVRDGWPRGTICLRPISASLLSRAGSSSDPS